MAAAAAQTQRLPRATTAKPPRPKLACFSFAAYAKSVIDHLKSLNIPVLPGLTDPEFFSVESTFGFSFPPDLRSILQEGLPIGPGFPNWRSSSFQQLHILINLPKFSLLKEISHRNFWCRSWGPEPADPDEALSMAKQFLDRVPILVPIYKNCYIPTMPNMAGNPVFYVKGGDVRVLRFDLAGFFQNDEYSSELLEGESIDLPAWAATEARAVEFWTEVAERVKRGVARGVTEGWWNGGDGGFGCLEDVFWKLREGGWKEEEVREMMMMNGDDERESGVTMERERIVEVLLDGGWSREDVALYVDLEDDSAVELESTFEINLQCPVKLPKVECKGKASRIKFNRLMKYQRPHFMFAPTHQNLIL